MSFTTIDEIKAANRAAGEHWFSKDTMAWFNSRIESGVYGGRFFVTSERDGSGQYAVWHGKRRYSIRRANDDGTIDTVGECGQFASLARATQAARALQED